VKNYKMWMSCVTKSSELQSALTFKGLALPGEKLNIVPMCAATNGAHIEICWAQWETLWGPAFASTFRTVCINIREVLLVLQQKTEVTGASK
jgi:hypothetical protein